MELHPFLVQFQERLYSHLDHRAHAVMELVNALSGNTQARSVVERSLSSLFGPHYSDLYKAIDAFALEEEVHWRFLKPFLPRPQKRSFWLLGVDVLPHPRGSGLGLPAHHSGPRLFHPGAPAGEAAR